MPTAFNDTSYFCESLCDRAVLSKTNKSPLYFSNVHLYLLQCSSGKDVRIVTCLARDDEKQERKQQFYPTTPAAVRLLLQSPEPQSEAV